jgi:hypothetical protein
MGSRPVLRVLVLLAAVGALLVAPIRATASTAQLAMFEDDLGLLTRPAATLSTLRGLGAGAVRVVVRWSAVAPRSSSRRRPRGFDAANPGAYARESWAPYDAIVNGAQRDGIQVELLLSGGAPRWATGGHQPRGGPFSQWRPSAKEYGAFAEAVARRYSGSYVPPGSSSALPRVHFWEIWNEANFGQNLAPQAINGSTVSASPGIYRSLLDAGWAALQRTGHGRDEIVIGSLSPRGFNGPPTRRFPQGLPGYFSTTKPLQFIRTLYCVSSSYRGLRGGAARAAGCPASARGSRRFRGEHPALFEANGFGIHPYPFDLPPTQADSPDPDYAEFSELPRLGNALNRLQRIYGSSRRPQIYNTEFGYITDPPNRSLHYGRHFLSPATAAYYNNWAEYISWRRPQIASYMQFLLNDPNPRASGFATGLLTLHGRIKPAYYAYRMPIYLPVTSTRRGRRLEVWGCVRPAYYAQLDTHQPQAVQIQFRRGSRGPFATVATVGITSLRGYFDRRVTFEASGSVRLAWSYPSGRTIYSREVHLTVR